MMQPKDLLVHLEKGDRTMEMVKKDDTAPDMSSQNMNTMFQNAFGNSQQWGGFGSALGQQQAIQQQTWTTSNQTNVWGGMRSW